MRKKRRDKNFDRNKPLQAFSTPSSFPTPLLQQILTHKWWRGIAFVLLIAAIPSLRSVSRSGETEGGEDFIHRCRRGNSFFGIAVSYHFYVRKARFPRRLYNATTSLTRPPLHFLLQQATRSAESIRSQPRRNPYKVSLHRVSSVRPSVCRPPLYPLLPRLPFSSSSSSSSSSSPNSSNRDTINVRRRV